MTEHCEICGKELSYMRNDSVPSTTYGREICFVCIQHKKFEDPHRFNFLLSIHSITHLERDVILNGICKNYHFSKYTNGAVWSESIIDTCEITTLAQLSDVMPSLINKGLIERRGSGRNATVRLTAEGYFYFLNNRDDSYDP